MDNRQVTDEIKAQLPVEQLISSYLPLKKAGRIYKALCPFHSEKSPSFTVSPDRGIYKCFGCGEGGDIFDFVMKIEGLTFPEATRLLAEKAGVQLPEWKPETGGAARESGISKTKLFEVNAYTAKLWHTILTQHPKAETARAYLSNRGVTPETIAKFQIGYAPFGSTTAQSLQKAGFSRQEIRMAGDPTKMQDRIIFPICDLTGKIVGFTGRLLEVADDPNSKASRGPKYWNTPETPTFVKSRTVYALHLAKHAIHDQKLAILAEGQMDVIMLHQAGYQQAVASSGTALTLEQLKLIQRFSPAVAFAYDQDKAGIEATKRGIELALEAEITPVVIAIPDGKDPAEAILRNPAGWQKAYEKRLPYMDWLINEATEQESQPYSADVKKQLAKELLTWVAKVPSPTEQADWFRRLSAKLGTSEENLRELFRRVHPSKHLSKQSENERQPTRSQASPTHLAETALAILITFPETFPIIRHQLNSFQPAEKSEHVARMIPLLQQAPDNVPLDSYLDQHLSAEERKNFAILSEELLQPYADTEMNASWAASELTLLLQRLRSEARSEEKSRLAKAIRDAQELGDSNRLKELFAELQKLI